MNGLAVIQSEVNMAVNVCIFVHDFYTPISA